MTRGLGRSRSRVRRTTRAGAGRRWMRALVWLLLPPMAAASAWLAGLALFAANLPQTVADSRSATDAIVVATGGSERVPVGLALLDAGLARSLLVSGVGKAVTLADLEALGMPVPPHLRARVHLGHAAIDTLGNAEETARWMTARGYTSLRLVTAAYHMPRSLLEFRMAMPGVTLVPHPVFPEAVKQQEWWRWEGTARLIAGEYTKFLVAWVRGRLRGMIGDPAPQAPAAAPQARAGADPAGSGDPASPVPSLPAPAVFSWCALA